MNELDTQIPAQDMDAEQAVISSVLIDNQSMEGISLKPNAFYNSNHRIIWETILEMRKECTPIDEITLADHLDSQKLKDMGGSYFLMHLGEKLPTSGNIKQHASIVREKAKNRYLKTQCQRALQSEDTDEMIKLLRNGLDNLAGVNNGSMQHISEIIDEFDSEEAYTKMSQTCINIGIEKFDNNVIIKPGDFVVIAGRPSMGKTAIMLHMAKQAAKNNHATGIFSIEMRKEYLLKRLAHSESIESGYSGYKQGYNNLFKLPLFIEDTPGIDIDHLHNQISYCKRKYNLDWAFIDYLQIMDQPDAENANRSVTKLSGSIKQLARDFNMPIVALCQLSRGLEYRAGKRPQLSDLRDSGAIEQDADVVLFSYRPFAYNSNTDKEYHQEKSKVSEEMELFYYLLLVSKNRDGALLDIRFHYNLSNQSFHLWDSYHTKPF